MKKQPLTVVLIGIGGYGARYAKALMRYADKGKCTLVGVVDPVPEKSVVYGALTDRGIPVFQTPEAFYTSCGATLCVIATPTHLHTPYAAYAMAHGSHVLCEKPLSGSWADGIALDALSRKTGCFMAVGYQWSYSDAILRCKRDLLKGKLGKPLALKTLILSPCSFGALGYGSGWRGKQYASDGTPIFDSIANNAAAHYLHNMLFMTGETMQTAADFASVDAELLRANPIESFDSCALRLHLKNGAEALFYASHATKKAVGVKLSYEFEHGRILFGKEETDNRLMGYTNDGEVIDWGDPFAFEMQKVEAAMEACRNQRKRSALVCTAKTATPHARCICTVSRAEIVTVPFDMTEISVMGADENDTQRSVLGLSEAMLAAYDEGCLLSELEEERFASLRTILKPRYSLT